MNMNKAKLKKLGQKEGSEEIVFYSILTIVYWTD